MKYFKNVTSYEDLKNQYRNLLKANHPDNGGNEETMKEINIQYAFRNLEESPGRKDGRNNP